MIVRPVRKSAPVSWGPGMVENVRECGPEQTVSVDGPWRPGGVAGCALHGCQCAVLGGCIGIVLASSGLDVCGEGSESGVVSVRSLELQSLAKGTEVRVSSICTNTTTTWTSMSRKFCIVDQSSRQRRCLPTLYRSPCVYACVSRGNIVLQRAMACSSTAECPARSIVVGRDRRS